MRAKLAKLCCQTHLSCWDSPSVRLTWRSETKQRVVSLLPESGEAAEAVTRVPASGCSFDNSVREWIEAQAVSPLVHLSYSPMNRVEVLQ